MLANTAPHLYPNVPILLGEGRVASSVLNNRVSSTREAACLSASHDLITVGYLNN